MDRSKKLLKAKSKVAQTGVQVEFVNTGEVYKQLENIYKKIDENNQAAKDMVKEAVDIIGEVINEVSEGVNIKNAKDIKIEPTFNTPEVKIPEIKMPEIKVPEPSVIQEPGLFSKYTPADIIKDGSTTYYGYLAKTGEWVIMRETTTKNTSKYRFSSGSNNFSKAFNSRNKLSYKYLDEVEL